MQGVRRQGAAMTTIAWDGKTVAADGLGTCGQYALPGNFKKIIQKNGIVFAGTGTLVLLKPMIKWYFEGADPKECPCSGKDEFTLLVFRNGKVLYYRTETPYAAEFAAPDAWGSGAEFAIGAMHAGADARRAVEIAAICNTHTGRDIISVDLSDTDVSKPPHA
jgi:ATP-dependent protease HslVU (ClpYQ) peptidase subunit